MTDFEAMGGCLCGAVRFRVTAEPLAAYYCHCTMCQKNGGGPFMVGATVPIEAFAFTNGAPKAYESSPGFMRLSCSQWKRTSPCAFFCFDTRRPFEITSLPSAVVTTISVVCISLG